MFGWFKSRREVKVYLNPLAMHLAARERQKGSALTRAEVEGIRDNAKFIMMSPAEAKKFYAVMDAQFPFPRMDPGKIWEQWQILRHQIRLS